MTFLDKGEVPTRGQAVQSAEDTDVSTADTVVSQLFPKWSRL